MPGLCGFTLTPEMAKKNPAAILTRMQDELVHRPHHIRTPLYIDPLICAAGVHLQQVLPAQAPYADGELDIWIDGEFYPLQPSPAATLAQQYRHGLLLPFLKKIDGIFTAVIYDRTKRLVHIMCDRYGLKPLYLTHQKEITAWASEIKAFRCISGLEFEMSEQAIIEFLGQGHFSHNRTWFDTIKLIDPGSVVSVALDDHNSILSEYWSFSNVQRMNHIENIDTLAAQLGELFIAAVEKRCGYDERIGLGLSGGLDSRALFAAIPEEYFPLYVVTFGKEHCADIRIATQVAALRPSKHIIQTIDASNWLENRFTGIWLTDGQISLQHMHGIEKIDEFRNYYDIELNGFLGDALLGGSYGNATEGEISRFYNRGRRFIAIGLSLGNLSYYTRIPFFDNDLMELTVSIPLIYRKNSLIYNKMLLQQFPSYFNDIPWQKTGMSISKTGRFWDTVRILRKGFHKLSFFIPGWLAHNEYVDYAAWIRREPTSNRFRTILSSPDAMIHRFIDQRIIQKDLDRHLSGRSDRTEILCRYMTLEIWMRQFFRNELL